MLQEGSYPAPRNCVCLIMRSGLRGAATVSVEGKEVVGGGVDQWVRKMRRWRRRKDWNGVGALCVGGFARCNTISVQMKRNAPLSWKNFRKSG